MSYQFSTTNAHSDETYLESFVESILSASLPNDIRRTLEHLRELDRTNGKLMEEWRDKQDSCLESVEETLTKVFRNILSQIETQRSVDEGEQIESASKRRRRFSTEDDNDRSNLSSLDDSQGGKDDLEAEQVTNSNTLGDCEHHDYPDKPDQSTSHERNHSSKVDYIPSNNDILSALHIHNPQTFETQTEINQMYHELQQNSREKIQTAHQLTAMVDMALGRLNRDLEKFEKELGLSSSDEGMGNGSGDRIIGHSASLTTPSIRKASMTVKSASVSSAVLPTKGTDTSSTASRVSSASSGNTRRTSLTMSTAASTAYNTPHLSLSRSSSSGNIDVSRTMHQQRPKKDLAAIQLMPNSPDWILAQILSYDKVSRIYTLSDEDMDSNKIYHISERQVVVLKGAERNRWNRGEQVYAVYPDTTSFYPATVSSGPKNSYVMVHFQDDGDAEGVTHEKAVPVWLVMAIPKKDNSTL